MRKVLLTIALCLSLGFAQAQTALLTCDFHDGIADASNNYTGTGYSTGVVTGGTEAHGQSATFARWRRWPNVNQSTIVGSGSNTMSSGYPYLYQSFGSNFGTTMVNWADTATSSAENGFMMMSMIDQRIDQTGNFNAYIQFSTVNANSAGVIDVQFYQYYRKFYDYCYIDYRIGSTGSWSQIEINVGGVDVTVNSNLDGFVTYTLPLAAASQANLDVRIRWKSLNSHRSNAYGYYWLIDDVSIIAGPNSRVRTYEQEFVEGNYGTIPQGMTINPAWYGRVWNNGAVNQTNVIANIKHLDASQSNTTTLSSYNNGILATGDFGDLVCDPAGWIRTDTIDYRGWYNPNRIGIPHGSGIPMPTSIIGDHYLYTNMTSTNGLSHNFDTMFYRVATCGTDSIYTWGHDNGMLAYSPYNYYIFGYVLRSDYFYVTEDPDDVHFDSPGYSVTSRYTTSSSMPSGWRILGVELVASPSDGFHDIGTQISAVLSKDVYTGNSINCQQIATGSSIHSIALGDINTSSVIGRNSNGYLESGQYNTIQILFPQQPLLQSNTSYRIGYTMESSGNFAVAKANPTSYRTASPSRPDTYDTLIYFKNNPTTRKYAYPPTNNQYQVRVVDYFYSNYSTFANRGVLFPYQHYDAEPMIRMLVGPYRPSLMVKPNNTTMGRTSGSGFYSNGQTVSIAAIPNNGYSFYSWQDGNTSNPRTIVFSPNDTLYTAIFGITSTVSINGNTTAYTGISTTYTAVANPSTATITWNLPGATPSTATGNSITATWATPGTYSIIVTADYSAYTVSDTIAVTVLQSRQVSFTCSGTGSGIIQSIGQANHDLCGDVDIYANGSTVHYEFIPDIGSNLTHLYVDGIDRINDATVHSNGAYRSAYSFSMNVNANSTINAVFDLESYQVTVYSENTAMGIVTGGGSFVYDSMATITATPMPHYQFDHWTIDSHGAMDDNMWSRLYHNPLSFNVRGDITLTAHFTSATYTITAIPNNVICGTVTGGGTYTYLEPVTLSASPYSGYRFLMWNNGRTHNPYVFPATENVVMTAVFVDENDPTQYYSLTVDANDATMGHVSGGGAYTMGETATLTATPYNGFHFVQWQDGNTDNPRFVTVLGDASYTAYFTSNQNVTYTITTVVNDNTMGFVTGGGVYPAGSNATLTAIPFDNYVFDRWGDNVATNPREIAVTADATYVAFFHRAVGIESVDYGLDMDIYPNPASGSVTISLSGISGHVEFCVMDVEGRKVMSDGFVCTGDCTTRINLANLAQGIYFVQAITEDGSMTAKKLVVK